MRTGDLVTLAFLSLVVWKLQSHDYRTRVKVTKCMLVIMIMFYDCVDGDRLQLQLTVTVFTD